MCYILIYIVTFLIITKYFNLNKQFYLWTFPFGGKLKESFETQFFYDSFNNKNMLNCHKKKSSVKFTEFSRQNVSHIFTLKKAFRSQSAFLIFKIVEFYL